MVLSRVVGYVSTYWEQMKRFVLVGVCLQILSMFLLDVFIEKMLIDTIKANYIQTVVLHTLSFLINVNYAWARRKVSLSANLVRAAKFVPYKVVVWYIHQFIFGFWLLLDLHYQLANAAAVLMVMGLNFLVYNHSIFLPKRE